MKTRIYVSDIECANCAKTLNARFRDHEAIHSFNVEDDYIDFEYNDSLIKPPDILQQIRDAGFNASLNPFARKSISERFRDMKDNPHKYTTYFRGLGYAGATLLAILLLEVIAYFGFLHSIPGFFGHYAWWIFYLDVSVVALGLTIWHLSLYKANVSCMVGMMIGMTVGMQTGLLLGTIVGATNGFFTGAMVGMITGVAAGIIMGRCCGIMGIMEGMMAGVMGGTMGPMISVMMFADNLLWFMPVYVIINLVILGGLSYMFHEEIVEGNKDIKKHRIDFATFASAAIIVASVLMVIMVYGLKSPLFRFG